MKIFLTLLPFLAFAAPQGLHVMSGNAHYEGHEIHVSEPSVLHWDSYSIAAHEHIHYPASHATVNRVTSDLPSEIHGRLSSNGPLWLINPNGIVIGENGRINAASFLASTLDEVDGLFTGHCGRIEQRGVIECPGGYVVLMAAEGVEQTGTIRAAKVGIAAGQEILFSDSLLQLKSGFAAAIQCKGLIEATGLEERGGEVYLIAEEKCEVEDGEIHGRVVHVLGEKVGLLGKTTIDVSGKDGGGTILIGIDDRGGNAKATFIGKEALLKADALESGDGGKVIVWSDEVTRCLGKISVRGGEKGGNGGFAEVSGKSLDYRGLTDGKALKGKHGKLLLDPNDIEIGGMATTGSFTACPDSTYTITEGTATNQILNTDLEAQLQLCDVTISTVGSGGAGPNSGSITVSSEIGAASAWDQATTLTLHAASFIAIDAAITCSGAGGMDFTNVGGVSASYNGISINAALTTTGGPISLSGVGGTSGGNRGVSVAATGSVTSNGGDITFHDCRGGITTGNSHYGVYVGASIDAGAGAVVFDTIEGGNGGTTGATSHIGLFFDAGTITGSTIEMTGLLGGHGGAGATAATSNYGFFMDTGATLGSVSTTFISITATGGSGEGVTSFNNGIHLDGGTIQTDSTTGTLTLTGMGGGNPLLSGTTNRGIYFASAITITTGPSITLTGIGGSGAGLTGNEYGVSIDAAQTLTLGGMNPEVEFLNCQGGNGGSGNYGVRFNAGFDVGTAALKLTNIQGGTGGTSGSITQYAVRCITGTVTGATIAMTGLVAGGGATGAANVQSNHGITLETGATLGSATTTSISIEATGGSGEGVTTANRGIEFSGGAIQTDPMNGTVTLMGTGGGNPSLSGSTNHGILFTTGSATITTGPSLTLTGVGGDGSGGSHRGVYVFAAPVLTIGGMDPEVEFLNCQGGNGGTGNVGVRFDAGFDVGVATGVALRFTDCHGGAGETSGATSHYGVYCNTGTVTGATIEMTGIIGGQGAAGATAVSDNTGFFMDTGATLGTSAMAPMPSTSSISIEATGGNGTGTTSSNFGIRLSGGTVQTDTTSGTVTLVGTGGGDPSLGGSSNFGVNFASAATTINTGTSMEITGVGGSGTGGGHRGANVTVAPNLSFGGMNPVVEFLNCQGGSGGTANYGAYFLASFNVGSAALRFTDITGGSGGTSGATAHYGVYCDGGTVTGASIEMTGIVGGQGAVGATSATTNYGFHIDTGATLGTTSGMHPTTSIIIEATGGNGEWTTSTNYGIRLGGGTLQVHPTTGTISLTGTGGGNPLLAGSINRGITTDGSSTTIITGTSAMTGKSLVLTGIGGSGSGGAHRGISIFLAPTLTIGGTGPGGALPVVEFLNCQGGIGGTGNVGVQFDGGFNVGSAALLFTDCTGGTGGTSGSTNHYGVYCTAGTVTGSTIEMTGLVGGHGAVGATNVLSNLGLRFDGGATLGTTSTSSIIIEATGGNGEGATTANGGIALVGGLLQVDPTTGTITLTGTGGGNPALAGFNNTGIGINGAVSIITGTSMGQSLILTGRGGNGSGGLHKGISVDVTPTLTIGGDSPIVHVSGCRGGSGGNGNVGVVLASGFNAGAAVDLQFSDCRGGDGSSSHGIQITSNTTSGGSVTMEGIAISSSTGSSNGVEISGSGTLTSTGTKSITGTVQAGAGGTDNNGILLSKTNPITGSGAITLNGTSLAAGANSHGISITSSWSTSSSALLQMTGSSASAFDINLGANITHSGAFTCHSPLRIDGTTRTITSAGATTFADTIDAVTTGGLTLSAGSGLIALEGALGSLVPLGPVSLTTSPGTGVELHANATASSFTTTGTTKMKLFQTATTIDTTGAISFGGTVDGDTAGMQSLTLNAGSTITIGGIVGGAAGLGTFEATASNVLLNADITATQGAFDADVTVMGDRTLKHPPP